MEGFSENETELLNVCWGMSEAIKMKYLQIYHIRRGRRSKQSQLRSKRLPSVQKYQKYYPYKKIQ